MKNYQVIKEVEMVCLFLGLFIVIMLGASFAPFFEEELKKYEN
jgi:hypothetical protein